MHYFVRGTRSPYKHTLLSSQMAEAGGYELAQGAGIISLLPVVANALVEAGQSEVPRLAAGEVADGKGDC